MKQDEQTTGPSSANRRFMPLAMLGIGIVALPYFAGRVGNGSLALSAAVTSAKPGVETKIKDLHPFTHLASIPASSDPAKIKFEKVKATRVFTKEKTIVDPSVDKICEVERDPLQMS